LTEDAAEETTGYSEEDEDEVVDGVVVDVVVGLKQHEFPSAVGVEGFEDDGCEERAEESSPEDLARKVGADFL